MAISLRLLDLDTLFNTASSPPIVVNSFNVNSSADKERLNQLIYTHYEGDSLNVLPSCECGQTTGEYNVGIKCEHCNTKVMSVTERPLESVLWIKPPEGVATFINPQAWTIMAKGLTHPGANLLEWLTNPTAQLPLNPPKQALKLQAMNIERGINYFYAHFDEIIKALFDAGIVNGTRQYREDLWQFIQMNRASIFAQHLPIPSKLGFITEKTVTSTYADLSMLPAVDAIRTISATVNSPIPLSLKVLQARAIKANMLLAQYHQDMLGGALGRKEGWFRKHVFGSRLHFTFRAVISSLSDNHDYDEMHLPWSMSVMVFKTHLTSKLMKRGFTPNECNKFLYEHTLKYHPLLDELFQELINESPFGGFPIILGRNPTLVRGSMQAFRVTKIKTDPAVNSISMSVLTLRAPNADFDGDALNGMLILDARMYHKLQRLAPHHGVLDLTRPRTLSRNIQIPAQVVSTIGAWVHEGR